MKKRLLSLLLTFMMLITLFAGCRPADPQQDAGAGTATDAEAQQPAEGAFSAAMVTDTGGVNDKSFNQSAWEGLQRAERELGVRISYLESKQDADYAPNLEQLTDANTNLIWGIGFKMADTIREAAEAYPEQHYAIIDNDYGNETPQNVVGVMFKEQEAAFLVGYIAGKTTQTNKIGFVGGMDVPVIQRFQYGFMAGVKYAAKEDNKNVDVMVEFAESFNDDTIGRAKTKKLIQQGADIVFHAAGKVGEGVIAEAKDQGKMAIGVDMDQSYLAPDTVITSAVKNVGTAIFNITQMTINNQFPGGTTVTYGLAEGGVDFAQPNDKVAAEVVTRAQALKQKIAAGEIQPPPYKGEYEAFLGTLQ